MIKILSRYCCSPDLVAPANAGAVLDVAEPGDILLVLVVAAKYVMFVDLVGIAAKLAHILVDSFGTGKQVPVIDYTAALIGPSVDIAADDIVAAFAVDTVSVVETADVDMEATEAVVAVGKSPLAADRFVDLNTVVDGGRTAAFAETAADTVAAEVGTAAENDIATSD